MSTVIERLNITAILAADPIPDEPMTLAELHKVNGGFPFRAKRIVKSEPMNSPGGTVHTFIAYHEAYVWFTDPRYSGEVFRTDQLCGVCQTDPNEPIYQEMQVSMLAGYALWTFT